MRRFTVRTLFVVVTLATIFLAAWRQATLDNGPVLRGRIHDDAGEDVSKGSTNR